MQASTPARVQTERADISQYLPILAMIVLTVAFAGISLIMSRLVSPKRSTRAKRAPFECGIIPSREPPERFPVQFYMVALLFIVFDIEIIFLYPWAVIHRDLGVGGLVAIAIFGLPIFLSLVYEIANGGLNWGPLHRSRRLSPMVSAERTTATTVRRVGLEGRDERKATIRKK